MAVSPAKENILKRIRQALSNPVPLPFRKAKAPVPFSIPTDDLGVLFAQEFTSLQGKFALHV